MKFLSTVAMLALLALPAALLAASSQLFPAAPAEISQQTEPILASVSFSEEVATQAVITRLSYADPQVLVAPSWDGVVTQVLVGAGDEVSHGTIVADVADSPVVAMSTPRPFARNLAAGDRGPDVEMLQQMLADEGYDPGPVDGRYGSGTGRAVKEWRTSLADPAPSTRFAVADVVWLDEPIASVATMQLVAGVPVPAPGASIVFAEQLPLAAVVVDPSTGELITETDGFSLWASDTNLGSPMDGRLTASQLAELERLVDDGKLDPNPDPTAPTPPVGEVARPQAEFTEFSTEIRQDVPARKASLPGSAVLVDDAGQTCVLIEEGPQTYGPAPIEVLSGALDSVSIAPETAPGGNVLVNPLDFVDEFSCG